MQIKFQNCKSMWKQPTGLRVNKFSELFSSGLDVHVRGAQNHLKENQRWNKQSRIEGIKLFVQAVLIETNHKESWLGKWDQESL